MGNCLSKGDCWETACLLELFLRSPFDFQKKVFYQCHPLGESFSESPSTLPGVGHCQHAPLDSLDLSFSLFFFFPPKWVKQSLLKIKTEKAGGGGFALLQAAESVSCPEESFSAVLSFCPKCNNLSQLSDLFNYNFLIFAIIIKYHSPHFPLLSPVLPMYHPTPCCQIHGLFPLLHLCVCMFIQEFVYIHIYYTCS